MVDLHIDETNDPACCGLKPLVAALARARAAGYTGQVVLGHCTSLALQPAPTKLHVIEGLAKLGGVTVVCNPTTNLGLQVGAAPLALGSQLWPHPNLAPGPPSRPTAGRSAARAATFRPPRPPRHLATPLLSYAAGPPRLGRAALAAG